jgi:CelD/BcsL family acetyltransferase involved in cellulose biosynthesis
LAEDWAALAARAETPNVFFDPAFALPAAEALGVQDQLHAALFWWAAGQDEQEGRRHWWGFVPLIRRRRWVVTPTNLEVWAHPYGPSSVPLSDPDFTDDMGRALVRELAATSDMPRIMVLPQLVIDSAFAVGLLGAGAPLFVHGGFQKPVAAQDLDGDAYIAKAIRSNRRNRLKRQRRQLSEQGALQFRMLGAEDDLKAGCARYLALEAEGWKGRGGTALSYDARGLKLFEGVTANFIAADRLRVAELMLDDQPVASLIILWSEHRCWFWKIAFDERHVAHSPGRLLLVDAVTAVLNEVPGIVIDSCAGVAEHFSGNVLREREAVGTVLLSTRPRPNIVFRSANLLEHAREVVRFLRQKLRG